MNQYPAQEIVRLAEIIKELKAERDQLRLEILERHDRKHTQKPKQQTHQHRVK
jgi:hypothetical protein